jgi:hypothetical protein
MAFSTVPIKGHIARISDGGVAVGYTTGWNINVVTDMSDAARQGQNWKEVLGGQASWSGSMELQLVLGNTYQKVFIDNILAGTAVKITDVRFCTDAALLNAFYGDIYINGFNTAPSVSGGVVTASINFTGDGSLSVESTT